MSWSVCHPRIASIPARSISARERLDIRISHGLNCCAAQSFTRQDNHTPADRRPSSQMSTPPRSIAISAVGLVKEYPGAVRALDGVLCERGEGEVFEM